jgi:hypothetical protein
VLLPNLVIVSCVAELLAFPRCWLLSSSTSSSASRASSLQQQQEQTTFQKVTMATWVWRKKKTIWRRKNQNLFLVFHIQMRKNHRVK